MQTEDLMTITFTCLFVYVVSLCSLLSPEKNGAYNCPIKEFFIVFTLLLRREVSKISHRMSPHGNKVGYIWTSYRCKDKIVANSPLLPRA